MNNSTKTLLIILLFSIPIMKVTAVTVFLDDGSGTNPNTAIANNWVANPGWSIGGTVQDIANKSAFIGTSAATDMINMLGASNQVISVDLAANSSISSLELTPLSFTTPDGRNLVFPFSQTAINNTASLNTTIIFDNFRIEVEDVIGGVNAWLFMDMYIIQDILIQGTRWLYHEDVKANGSIFNVYHSGTEQVLIPGVYFTGGTFSAHTTFADGEALGIRSDAIVLVPVPAVAWLFLLGLVGLRLKR